ncbi:MAG: hypothetical protein ABIJ16_01365 [Bacteroidota bacterium]
MKLRVKCKKCREVIFFSSRAHTRNELATGGGDIISIPCPKCSNNQNFHLDSVFAVHNRTVEMIFMAALAIVFILIGILVWQEIWRLTHFYAYASFAGLVAIPVAIYIIVSSGWRKKIKEFNRQKYKSKKK